MEANIIMSVRKRAPDNYLVHQVTCHCDELNKGRMYAILRRIFPEDQQYEIEIRRMVVKAEEEDALNECKNLAFYEDKVLPKVTA